MHLYLDRVNNKKPEPGQYDVQLPEKHMRDIDFDKMQSRADWADDDKDDKDLEGDVLILDPTQPPDHVPGPDFAKQFGRGEDFVDSDGEKDEIIIDPKLDLIRKREGLGGAIPLAKQVGRPVEIDLEDDAEYVVSNDTAAIPNDPSKPRVIVPTFDKQGARFKYDPDQSERPDADEVMLPAEVKPIDREKVLFKMDKQQDRFPLETKKEQFNLSDLAGAEGEFRGTDLADVDKAFKATLPHEAVPDFTKYQSLAKFRVDLPPDPYGGDEPKKKEVEEET